MEKLGINPVQLVAQIVNIGLLIFILNKFLYKPLTSFLDNRKKTIEDGFKKASEYEQKESKLKQKEDELVKQMHKKSSETSAAALKDAKVQSQKIVADAKEEAVKIKKDAHEQMDKYKKKLESEMEGKVVEMATTLANNALGEILAKDTRIKITEQQIKKAQSIWQKSH